VGGAFLVLIEKRSELVFAVPRAAALGFSPTCSFDRYNHYLAKGDESNQTKPNQTKPSEAQHAIRNLF
jgi:peroxiredoxin